MMKLEDLPVEMLVCIISFLTLEDEVVLRQVCKSINEAFDHPYIVNYYESQRNHLLGKYRDIYKTIDHGIFPNLHKEPKSAQDYVNDLRILRNAKLMNWGNHMRLICGVGYPKRDIFEAPMHVEFPKGERIWFISHTYEYLAFAIMLSGRCYSWGTYPACQDKEYSVPAECKELNETFSLKDEIPIFSKVGHQFVGVLTNKGTAYYIRDKKISEVDVKGEFIERIFCTSSSLYAMYHKKEEQQERKIHVGVKYAPNPFPEHPSFKDYKEMVFEHLTLELQEDEVITRMDGGFRNTDIVFLTNQNRLYMNPRSSEMLFAILNMEGELYGLNMRGSNHYGVFGTMLPEYIDNFKKCDVFGNEEKRRWIKVSNGCDYSNGGHTLLMDEERNLYHVGCNVHGEHLMKPDKEEHRVIKLVPLKNILMFNANENYCSVIVY